MLLATDRNNTVLAESGPRGLNRLAYTAYGFQSAQRPVDSSLGFNGELRAMPTGWYHLGNGHRVYNPVLMRFHSPDKLSPFGKGGLNPYAYCKGDPINFKDPTGQIPEWLMPVATITAALLLGPYNITLVVANKLTGPALGAARIAAAASAVSVTAGVVRLAADDPKVKEVGMYLSFAALAISGAATVIRHRVNWLKIQSSEGPYVWNNGLRRFFGMGPKKKPVTPRSSADDVRRNSTDQTTAL